MSRRIAIKYLHLLFFVLVSLFCLKPVVWSDSKNSPVEEGFVPMSDGVRLYFSKFGNGPQKIVIPIWDRMKSCLPSKYFVRIHRSTIINLEYVERIEEWFHQSYRIHLKSVPQPLLMSRRYAARLKKQF